MLIPFVILTSTIITKTTKRVQEYSKKAKTRLNIFLSESIYGVKLIKIFNRQYEKEKECTKLCDDFYKSRVPTAFTEGFLIAFMVIFENLGVALIVWACVNHIFNINLDVKADDLSYTTLCSYRNTVDSAKNEILRKFWRRNRARRNKRKN